MKSKIGWQKSLTPSLPYRQFVFTITEAVGEHDKKCCQPDKGHLVDFRTRISFISVINNILLISRRGFSFKNYDLPVSGRSH